MTTNAAFAELQRRAFMFAFEEAPELLPASLAARVHPCWMVGLSLNR